MNRGFIICAQNNGTTDYIKCATVLATSIKNTMPGARVTLLTDTLFDNDIFDQMITFPWGDQCADIGWKLDNDWQVYDASPYEYTIKIESDIYLPRSIDYWWDILSARDLNITSTIRNFKNEISSGRVYRKIFDDNSLPDVYNGITYFKKSNTAENFFSIVRDIFSNWKQYKLLFRMPEHEVATTDVVYAIAAKIIGVERCTLPQFTDMSFIHMKQHIIDGQTFDWRNELLYEIHPHCLRIETIPQLYPFHYHIKDFARTLESEL